MDQKIERKLAAIMFTDIAGFTALSAKDESKALELLDTQKSIVLPTVKEFKGTIHKEMGDGLLITFPAVTNALHCGIEIQNKTKNIGNLGGAYPELIDKKIHIEKVIKSEEESFKSAFYKINTFRI